MITANERHTPMSIPKRIKRLLTQTVEQVEASTLKAYPRAQRIRLSKRLDDAIVIPPKMDGPYALLVAHTDTVFSRPPKAKELGQAGPIVFSKNPKAGIGADDRAGIAAALDLYDRLPNVAVLLCPNEETGCQGSSAITKAHLEPHLDLDQVSFALQFDRRGSRDIVTYNVADKDFIYYLEEGLPGYAHTAGSYSDVCELCPTLGVQGANLSIGYVNEHTPHETLDLFDYQRTVVLVQRLLEDELYRFELFMQWEETDAPEENQVGIDDDLEAELLAEKEEADYYQSWFEADDSGWAYPDDIKA